MESNINLLPEKDKQLKREMKPPKDVVEMSTPQDRVFQERVVRIGGVMEFFKNLFKRKPTPLPKTKAAAAPSPAPVGIPSPTPKAESGPVTRLQVMPDRLAPPPSPPKKQGWWQRIFSKKASPVVPSGLPVAPKATSFSAPLPVPPPPRAPAKPDVATLPPVPPPPMAPPPVAPRREAWTPPVPNVARDTRVAPLPPSRPPVAIPPAPGFAPPIPARPTGLSDVTPIVGAGLNVNLVPQEYQPEAPSKNRFIAAVAVGVAVVLVAGATVGLSLYRRTLDKKIADLDAKSAAIGQQISALESGPLQQALVLRQRTADVTKALDQHVYWDRFFEQIEGVTLPTVAYSSMSVDIAGSVTLAATATSFDEVGKQLLAFQQATSFITQATILSATKVSATSGQAAPGQNAPTPRELVSFSASLRVVPQIFYHSR